MVMRTLKERKNRRRAARGGTTCSKVTQLLPAWQKGRWPNKYCDFSLPPYEHPLWANLNQKPEGKESVYAVLEVEFSRLRDWKGG